jgi:hypothetical protein
VGLVGVLLSGCGAGTGRLPGVPAVSAPPPAPSGPPQISIPAYSAPPLPSLGPTSASPTGPPTFDAGFATQCNGYPALSRIVSLLRDKNVIGSGGTPTAELGPLCASDWQYTIVDQSGHEPLQVVTKGTPTSLSLVTAGTDVCTVKVRSEAPPGILTAAHC